MGLLADTFRTRLEAFLQAHAPTRVLIGGLPDFMLERISAAWNAPFRLFLIDSAGSSVLPASVERCRADDLTAHRQHAWAALVSAHESRSVQESIRSSGAGTVRELWSAGFPWRPCELPGARWRDIRDDYIKHLGLSSIRKEAAACIECFRDELSGEIDSRARFFAALDGLTGAQFSYDDLCFQVGLPSHPAGRALKKTAGPDAVVALLDQFVACFKDDVVDDVLEEFCDIAQVRYAEDLTKLNAVCSALGFFASQFRHIQPADAENSVRAWRASFEASRSHWAVLSADVLGELLKSTDGQARIQLTAGDGEGTKVISIGSNQVLIRSLLVATPAIGCQLEFNQILVDAAQGAIATAPWRLFAHINRLSYQRDNGVPLSRGPHAVAVPLPFLRGVLLEGKIALRMFVGPNSGSEQATSNAVQLWSNCSDYPFILAHTQSTLRPGRRKRSKDEQGNTRYDVSQNITLPTQGRAVLHGFIYNLNGSLCVLLPESSSPTTVAGLTRIPESHSQQFSLVVDVAEGAEATFTWNDASGTPHAATVTFDFKGDSAPREDSMTGVLMRAHAGVKSQRVKGNLKLLSTGGSLPPSELAVKETDKAIALWELQQQDPDCGWWPILVSNKCDIHEQRLLSNVPGCLRFSSALRLNDQTNAWRSAVESMTPIGPMPAEISAFVAKRKDVLDSLEKQFSFAHGESASDVNIARKSAFGFLEGRLVVAYLDSYTSLLRAAKQSDFAAQWRLHAWCVDSVLVFADGATGPLSHLLGPFHPVTLSRLFFVQQCLGARLLEDELCPLANAFLQSQPLSLGHVLDAQLQPHKAIAFSTGEPHWLWLYRQQAQSDLPDESLVEWLRIAGLDPQTGPLGVDAEILPQTLKQYLLAYPSHQTVRLALQDCSQQTYEVLRSELLAENADSLDKIDRLKAKVPGGLSVYDPVTKVKRLGGELISFDQELPLRWHHCEPPASLGIDIATLQRSQLVNFRAAKRYGAFSLAVPIVRRGLVEFSSAGLEVATAPKPSTVRSPVAEATINVLVEFEPSQQQLVWGTSFTLQSAPKANWTLCSAAQVDPRLFIEYVRRKPGTALWTYRLFSLSVSRTPEFGRGHFLIARVSTSLATALQVHLTGTGLDVSPNQLLAELAESGLTLGDEFLRTGRTAEGAIGQYLVERLLWQPAGDSSPLPHWSLDSGGALCAAGFLLQIDPFSSVLDILAENHGRRETGEVDSRQRSDLLSIHLQFCGDELWIKPVVFESKFLKAGKPDIDSAVAQASATARKVDHLLEFCLYDETKPHGQFWSQPERLLLAELMHLGLRLSRGSFKGSSDAWHDFEQLVLTKVMSGDFKRSNAQAVAIVHSVSPTLNNLASAQPHAFVSFNDANDAIKGTHSQSYRDILNKVSSLLRHVCGLQPSEGLLPRIPVEMPMEALPPLGNVETHPDAACSSDAHIDESATLVAKPVNERIASAHDCFDRAFEDFIGNRQAVEKLRDDLVDALTKLPPHLPNAYLLTGNPSTGKTTLANKVATLLGITFVKLVGTNIRSEADLVEQVDNAFQASSTKPRIIPVGNQGLPEHEYPECLIFIDEIHLVKGRAQEGLLTLTEPKDRYVRLRDRICRFPRATYMAATTRDSEIDRALRTRFGNPIHLNDYKVSEVAQMLSIKKLEWANWSPTIRSGLAQLSRCIPREAERLAQKLQRKLAVTREPLTLDAALEKLRLEEGLDRNGLDQVCWETLRLLSKQPRPVGKDTLAQRLGIADEDKMVSEIIPGLQSLGLVDQVAGGQIITDRGRNYLRNEAAPSTV